MASTLIMKMVSTKYSGSTGIIEHIMMMVDMAKKLKTMDITISDNFLVHFLMTSLPKPKFEVFKVNYNLLTETWNVSELIAKCV